MGTTVYRYSLVSAVFSTLLLLGSQLSTRWFIAPNGTTYGLYKVCLHTPNGSSCLPFPDDSKETGEFRLLWKTAVFFLNLAIILGVLSALAYLSLLYILRQHHYRRHAKGAVTALVSSACVTVVTGIGITEAAFQNKEGFQQLWKTGNGFWMAAVSAVCLGFSALATLVWGRVAHEDGYEELA